MEGYFVFDFNAAHYYVWSPNYSGESEAVLNIISNGANNVENAFNVPKLNNVSPMTRRRYSQITKMSVEVAARLVEHDEQTPIFYYSNFGELQSHYNITKMIEETKSVSPTEFSYSTHNTAAGQISILMKNHKRAVAISASENTLETAFVQINSFMNVSGEKKALLLVCEEAVPDIYKDSYIADINPFGVFCAGVVITKENPGLRMTLSLKPSGEKCSIFDFLKFISSSEANKLELSKSEIVRL